MASIRAHIVLGLLSMICLWQVASAEQPGVIELSGASSANIEREPRVVQTGPPPVGQEKWLRYYKWLRDSGMWDERAEVVYIPSYGGYGVIAKEKIPAGTFLQEIPKSHWITEENLLQTADFKKMGDVTFPDYSASLVVYFMLEYRKGEASDIKPWFDVMDLNFNGLFMWSEDELEELQSSTIRHTNFPAVMSKHSYEVLARDLFPRDREMFPEDFFTLENYKRFYGLVVTRTFGSMNRGGSTRLPCLALLHSDMWNHNFDGASFTFEGDAFRLAITDDILPGEEITANYGRYNGAHFLSLYGFFPEPNPYESTEVSLRSNANTWPLAPLLRPMVDRFFSATPESQLYNVRANLQKGQISQDILTLGRVFSLEFSDVNSVSLDRLLQQKAISLKNEVKAIRKIIPALQEQLRAFNTTVEEDRGLLENTDLPNRKRLAIRQRLNDKETLVDQIFNLKLLWSLVLRDGNLKTGYLFSEEE